MDLRTFNLNVLLFLYSSYLHIAVAAGEIPMLAHWSMRPKGSDWATIVLAIMVNKFALHLVPLCVLYLAFPFASHCHTNSCNCSNHCRNHNIIAKFPLCAIISTNWTAFPYSDAHPHARLAAWMIAQQSRGFFHKSKTKNIRSWLIKNICERRKEMLLGFKNIDK